MDVQKDLRKAKCPYCHGTLEKIPGSKTKCPHCKKYMFVRTRAKSNARVVVKAEELEEIEEEWAIATGTHDEFLKGRIEKAEERQALKIKFQGQDPSEEDVKWSLLNKQLLVNANKGLWGLYTNTKREMAEILRRRGELEGALDLYLEVCVMDMNGPMNGESFDIEEGISSKGPFNLKFSMLAPGIVERISKISKLLKRDIGGIEREFMAKSLDLRKAMKVLPLDSAKGWKKLRQALIGAGFS